MTLCALTCIHPNLFGQHLNDRVSDPCLYRPRSVSSAVSTYIDCTGLRSTLEYALVTLAREKEAKISLY